ncbi:MAG: hypothetical protein GTN99_03765 [Candidatus Dadabacteria bacterium]|nr:hypothetical protein [Candidatus Dadabacteria bacterium]
MEENKDTQDEQKTPGMMDSVLMAFNMGVKKMQEEGAIKNVLEAGDDLFQEIYKNMQNAYGNAIDENFLKANAEYFLNIALLGYIFPTICAYDDEFKNKIFELIEKKLEQTQKRRQQSSPGGPGGPGGAPGGGNIIV